MHHLHTGHQIVITEEIKNRHFSDKFSHYTATDASLLLQTDAAQLAVTQFPTLLF